MNDYRDHRKRVRQRYRKEGLDDFSPIHALEILLFYAVPQKDTKPIARALIQRFGTFHAVLEADLHQLLEVAGVGENVAVYLSLLRDVSRYYRVDCERETAILNDPNDYGRYLMNRFVGRTKETVYLLCLDAKGKLLDCQKLGEGDMTSINLSTRQVVELAIAARASVAVLAHNHPSGLALPSPEDVAITHQLRDMLRMVGIHLADHIITSEEDFVSLAQSGFLGE